MPFGPLWFLGGLSGGGGAVAVDDRAPPAVRSVGARRHGGGRGGLRRDRVRLRAAAGAVGQRGVRPAAAAPAGALLRRRFDAPVAPGGVLVDARGGPGGSRGVDHAGRVPLGRRGALRLVPRDRALPQEPAGHRRRTGLERLPAHGVLPARWDLVDRGRDAPAARVGPMAAANPRLGRDDRGQQRDHDAVPVAHDRVPAGRAVAVAARVRPRPRQHPEVVAGTPVVDRRACPDPRWGWWRSSAGSNVLGRPDAIAPEARKRPRNARPEGVSGLRCAPPIGAARGGTFNHRATPPPRHRIRDPGRDRFGHRVRRLCDLRRDAGFALPAGVAAGSPTTGPVHLAREVHRVRRADGQLVDRGGGGLHRPGRRGVPDGPAGGLPRHDLVADGRRAGGRLSRRRLPVAVAVLARRLLLRLLRPHRGRLPPEPLRPHPRGVRRGFAVAAGGPEVGRHASGVRPAVHVAVGRHRPRHHDAVLAGDGLPAAHGAGEPGDAGDDPGDGRAGATRPRHVRRGGVWAQPGGAVPGGGQRAQRRARRPVDHRRGGAAHVAAGRCGRWPCSPSAHS